MTGVFRVEIEVTLRSPRRLTDDEITDVIEAVVDELDQQTVDPSVGTRRLGDDVVVTLALAIDEDEEFDALSLAVTAAKRAFAAAGVGLSGLAEPHDLRSRVLPTLAA